MALVRPIAPFVSVLDDLPQGVVLGPADVLRDDNPHVKARPDMFTEVRESFHGRTGVEQATAAPGQKRAR